ncbi:30S ribosomal protein S8 [Candidatus Micrarchaeota archaeon]|nr:30S ribosomal protein S8 [Candidatus Micrarchaeota archaeon]
MVDTLADALNQIFVSETKGRATCQIGKGSKLLSQVLGIFKTEGYIEEYSANDEGLSGAMTVKLLGKVNKCKAIKPRFSVKAGEWEKWEGRFLPARGLGVLVVSTSSGMMTHTKAKELKIGGRLIALVY